MSEKPSVSVYELVMVMADQTASVAWAKLGLHPDPMSGEICQDLAEAQVAIDLVAHLAAVLDEKLDESDRRDMQNLVRNLRMNFVEQSKSSC